MIEMMHFRLLPTSDLDGFLRADSRLQAEFAYRQPGLLRRTTARSDDGSWVVIDLWLSASDADSCAARWDENPVVREFLSFIDEESITTARYRELGS